MKKEVFLAIAIGFALGLVITFGIWTANKSIASIKTTDVSPTPTEEITGSTTPQGTDEPEPTSTTLTISEPEDELLTNKNTIVVAGKAPANATVAIIYEGDEQIVIADASGAYTATVNLIAGYNVITVTSFDATGAEASQSRTVTYSTAAI